MGGRVSVLVKVECQLAFQDSLSYERSLGELYFIKAIFRSLLGVGLIGDLSLRAVFVFFSYSVGWVGKLGASCRKGSACSPD